VLQCVAASCSVEQCIAVCCSVVQCVAICCSVCNALHCVALCYSLFKCAAVCCSVLQCVAVCCSVLQSPKRTSRMDIHMQGSSLNINVKKITEAHLYYNVSVCFSVFQ